ncbi:MAG TPA: hypothetical protein VFU41_04330 [Gemmatimonadales bacterium]|nr:hypothetical protein [Gemmatimonadales bacterium]
MSARRVVPAFGVVMATLLVGAPRAGAQEPGPPLAIADNSFLIEEAYNQERGVVQHINAFQRARGADSWVYTFTQEWPVLSQKHQLSLTVPVQRVRNVVSAATGLGDVALNYRYQLAGTERWAVAPRLSLLLPTGRAALGLGAGGSGVQLNLPVSASLARSLVTHWNAGATVTPSARNALGHEATTTGYNLGASAIWLARPAFNVLVEVAWARTATVTGPGATASEHGLSINPGIRWAHNFSSGLQIVPGIAFPIGVGPSKGEDALLLYLSFEHPFRKDGR